MENAHGLDISWFHHPVKDERTNDQHSRRETAGIEPLSSLNNNLQDSSGKTNLPASPPPTPSKDNHSNIVPVSSSSNASESSPSFRRPYLGRSLSDKNAHLPTQPSELLRASTRRNSWLTNLSAKLSSTKNPHNNSSYSSTKLSSNGEKSPEAQPSRAAFLTKLNDSNATRVGSGNLPAQTPPKHSGGSSFFTNALKRLSPGGQMTHTTANENSGAVCQRRVLNRNPNRERVLIPELKGSSLRRVAFMVDVQVGPRFTEDVEANAVGKTSKIKKLKEKAEGEVLKHPQNLDGEFESSKETSSSVRDKLPSIAKQTHGKAEADVKAEQLRYKKIDEDGEKENRRWKTEEVNEVAIQQSNQGILSSSFNSSLPQSRKKSTKSEDKPRTDPVRIYRRCCQLRETPILKRITEQLSTPEVCPIAMPGIVTLLDLSSSRLQPADFATLGDWLALVPVRKLLLDNANIDDEGIRVVLAGLLAVKVPESLRQTKSKLSDNDQEAESELARSPTAIERLSLRSNPRITKIGWKHISLFVHMCHSLKAIDLSLTPFPPAPFSPSFPFSSDHKDEEKIASADSLKEEGKSKEINPVEILSKAIAERRAGSHMEELIMGECDLTTYQIIKIVDGVEHAGIRRLGLACNKVDGEAMTRLVSYLRSGICTGLDLGSNDIRHLVPTLVQAFTESCILWGLSLADCNLDQKSLELLLAMFVKLPDLHFIDFSHNHELLKPDSVAINVLRVYMPRLKQLKRIHLNDVYMSAAQAIQLADVLPECPYLAHLNLLQNPELSSLASAADGSSQEDAVALYASLMAAVRISRSIITVDVETPVPGSSEVVKALAKQMLAYCLRNMEQFTMAASLKTKSREDTNTAKNENHEDVEVSEVLAHLVGDGTDVSNSENSNDHAPNDDYIVGGTGVVKALKYCLSGVNRNVDGYGEPDSNASLNSCEMDAKLRPMNMSKHLLEYARKIRARLQSALIHEARADEEMSFKRLKYLDNTINGIIQRFEEEFPECRITASDNDDCGTDLVDASQTSSAKPPEGNLDSNDDMTEIVTPSFEYASFFLDSDTVDNEDSNTLLRSRHTSDVSLASRALALEEGQVHKLSKHVQRGIMQAQPNEEPKGDYESNLDKSQAASRLNSNTNRNNSSDGGTQLDYDSYNDYYTPGPPESETIRLKLEALSGEEIRSRVAAQGYETMMAQIGKSAEALQKLKAESPEDYAKVKEAQMAAHVDILQLDDENKRHPVSFEKEE